MKLKPPDQKRCQADKPNGYTFMTLGGKPGLVRCPNKAKWIATENGTGQRGSMSLCNECREVLIKQLGPNYATLKLITPPKLPRYGHPVDPSRHSFSCPYAWWWSSKSTPSPRSEDRCDCYAGKLFALLTRAVPYVEQLHGVRGQGEFVSACKEALAEGTGAATRQNRRPLEGETQNEKPARRG